MSEWVVLDITAMTKSTGREKVQKILKAVSLYNKKRHKYLFKGIQFLSMIKIMTIFDMQLSIEIKFSMKELLSR